MCIDTGYNVSAVTRIRSQGLLPSQTEEVLAFAEYLGVSVDWLLEGKVERKEGDPSLERISDFVRFFMSKTDSELDSYRIVLGIPMPEGSCCALQFPAHA